MEKRIARERKNEKQEKEELQERENENKRAQEQRVCVVRWQSRWMYLNLRDT